VYTTEVIVEEQEFAESKNASEGSSYGGGSYGGDRPAPSDADASGFMNIPDGIDGELPFK
jgi:single-strand DNA-binding protein